MSYLGQNILMSGTHAFPNDAIPESKKDKKWYKSWCQAILYQYFSNNTFPKYSDRGEIQSLRAYGNSDQPIEEAMTRVFPSYGKRKSDGGEHERMAWDNIDPSILPVMTMMKQTILGKFQDIEHSLYADATDKFSSNEKEDRKFQAMADVLLQDVIDQVNSAVGKPTINTGEWKPRTVTQVSMFNEMGGFRLNAEEAIEKAVNHTFLKEVRWPRLKERIINDLVDLGFCVVEDYTDLNDQLARCRYVDPAHLITQYDNITEFENLKFFGFVKQMTIDDLRKTGEFEESQLKHIAGQYFKTNMIGSKKSFDFYTNYDSSIGRYGYDSFVVDVVKCRWRGFIVEHKKKEKDSRSRTREITSLDYSEAKTDLTDENVYVTQKEMWYKSTLIIGTDHVFDTGYEYDIMRTNKMTLRDPLNIVRMEGQPMTKRCVPSLKQIQLTWIKYQNAVSKMRPTGLAVEAGALSNVTIGSVKVTPRENLEFTLNNGSIIYKATNSRGGGTAVSKPIYELEGGMGRQFNEFAQMFAMDNSMIQKFSGITPEASGNGDVAERQSAQLSEMMYNNTNDNLRPIIQKYHECKQLVANNLAFRIQNIIRYSSKGREKYQTIMGKINADSVLVPESKTLRDIGITLFLMPDRNLKDTVIKAANDSLMANKTDGSGIDDSDFMLITMLVERGHMNDAKRYMSMKIRENKDRIQKQAEAAQEKQLANNLEMKKLEEEKELAKLNKEAEIKQKEHDYKMDEIDKEWDRKDENERIKRGLDQQVSNEKNIGENNAYNR